MKKTCWVTGAGSGIGRAIAEHLAGAGHRVILSGRSARALVELARTLGNDALAVPCDVTEDAAMCGILEAYGVTELDAVYLCAGTCEYIDAQNIDMTAVRRVMATNYLGVANTCVAALPLLRRTAAMPGRERPQLVGIGSLSSVVGLPRAEAYGASKAAMAYFLDSLRTDIGRVIDVTVVYPGFVATPMTAANDFPMPLQMSADAAAKIIIQGVARRPLSIAFPRRLHWLLHAANFFARLWYGVIAVRLSRDARHNANHNPGVMS